MSQLLHRKLCSLLVRQACDALARTDLKLNAMITKNEWHLSRTISEGATQMDRGEVLC
jgi:hypothetical protein